MTKYTKCYLRLMRRAKNRTLAKDVYTERHHIRPKCLGGLDVESNLVELTAQEHFIAHHLLVKIFSGVVLSKLWHAFYMMSVCGSHCNKRTYRVSSRLYSTMRKELSNSQKQRTTNSQTGTFWAFNYERKQCRKFKSGHPLPDGWLKGRILNWSNVEPPMTTICRSCFKALPKGRRSFCSSKCKNKHTYANAKPNVKIQKGCEIKFIKHQDLNAYTSTGWKRVCK